MIFKRTITSHMKPAKYDVYKINLHNDSSKELDILQQITDQLTFLVILSMERKKWILIVNQAQK